MERRRPAAALLVLAFGAAACSTVVADAGEPVAVVRALIDADNRGDFDAVLACYAEGVVWLPPGAEPVSGRTRIAERYRTMFATYAAELECVVEERGVAVDLAFVRGLTRGRLRPRAGGDEVVVHDTFVALLRLGTAGWRITHLCWHPRGPAPAR